MDSTAPRAVDPQENALVKDLLKRIDGAKKRYADSFKRFETNRQLLRGKDGEKKVRANLYFANLATMRPQVYAKDPEYTVQPGPGVAEAQLEAIRKFCETAEKVVTHCLVKEARLKKRAKRLLTSAYTTSVGWWKLCWQEGEMDPQIQNRLKDTQDNIQRVKVQREALTDQTLCNDLDLKLAELNQTLQGLQSQAEVSVARGLTLDFVLSEDIIILDPSVRELGDYERSSAIAHRVWMTKDKYRSEFGCAPEKGKTYSESQGQIVAGDKDAELLCVYEVWEQDSNRVYTVCDGEEGFCKPPMTPDWTAERWYPFFGLAFNEIEGTFYPLSDIELTQPQVEDINIAADDFKRDRKEALPVNVVRKGGSLTPDDIQAIKNRQGGDIILVEGVGTQAISADIFIGQLAKLDAQNYDTSQARAFMEQIVGGGDAARGTVMKAKTATEAEILSQGLRGRSAERTDTMEDLLTEVGQSALQILLRKLSPQEVQQIAGPDSSWPTMTTDQIFQQVTLEVRGGSTGKPDRLQEQDRWTKVMPVIEKTIQQVAELRLKGQDGLANALVELAKETLRRFDERLDLDHYLPPAEKQDPGQIAAENQMLKQQIEAGKKEMERLQNMVDKGFIQAASSVATSANPLMAGEAFAVALQALEQMEGPENVEKSPPVPPQPPVIAPQSAPLQ